MGFHSKSPTVAVAVAVMLLLCWLDGGVHCFPHVPGVAIQDNTGDYIVVHCHSQQDDMGTRRMHDRDVWTFKFHPDVSFHTNFGCSFAWDNAGKHNTASFSVWNNDVTPVYDFTINNWRVDKEGFYLYDYASNQFLFRHHWGVHQLADDQAGAEKNQSAHQKRVPAGGTEGV